MAASTQSRTARTAKKAASRTSGEFNSPGIDLSGTTPRAAGRFESSVCHTDGCGTEIPAGQQPSRRRGSVVLSVVGQVKTSWFCTTSCATRAMALADVRSLR